MCFKIITDWSWERSFQQSTVLPNRNLLNRKNRCGGKSLSTQDMVLDFVAHKSQSVGETPRALALKSTKYFSSWVSMPHSKTSHVSSSSDNKLGWLLGRWLWRVAACGSQSGLWSLAGRSAQTSKRARFLMAPQTAKKNNKPPIYHMSFFYLSNTQSQPPWNRVSEASLDSVLHWVFPHGGWVSLWGLDIVHWPVTSTSSGERAACPSCICHSLGWTWGRNGWRWDRRVDTGNIQLFPGLLYWLTFGNWEKKLTQI